MRTLFKTTDVLRFLYNFDCDLTAEDLKKRANGAEFLDSKFVKSKLNKEIYQVLVETYNQYTYKQ
jgi:hypothetical protein